MIIFKCHIISYARFKNSSGILLFGKKPQIGFYSDTSKSFSFNFFSSASSVILNNSANVDAWPHYLIILFHSVSISSQLATPKPSRAIRLNVSTRSPRSIDVLTKAGKHTANPSPCHCFGSIALIGLWSVCTALHPPRIATADKPL